MDLRKSYPRSPKDKFAGVVMLARTTDKARADKSGTTGEYHYNCPLDRAVFEFLGIDHEEYARNAAERSDAQLEAWVRETFVSKKSPAEIEKFNSSFLNDRKPAPGSESEEYFLEVRNKLDPVRTDIVTWPDLLDLEEGREVPRRVAA
jgi:hypothetical protein